MTDIAVQTNVVRTDGRRGALLTVLRNGQASTLSIVDGVKESLPKILAGLPSVLDVKQLFDQSIFVREAVGGVVKEAILAAMLTGLMILLFLVAGAAPLSSLFRFRYPCWFRSQS